MMWNPFKMLRTNVGKSSRLYIFILVIQDHIESIGKPILLKGDEVLLNGLLALMMLNDMLQSPQPLSHIHICPKPKVKLDPTEIIYPAPSSSLDIATTRKPSHFGLTDRDLGLTKMGLQILCDLLQHFQPNRVCSVGPTEFA